MEAKKELLGLQMEEMEELMQSLGEPSFRGRQVYKWIYQKGINSFYEMSDLPKHLRTKLDEHCVISMPRLLKQRVSHDGTRKYLLELKDKKRIESVIIPQSYEKEDKYTLCLSTQVGCPVGCAFCATGKSGFQRNLEAYEIVGQLLSSRRELSRKLRSNAESLITSVVYMGMGEPLLNYDATLKSIHILNEHRGINLGQRHITISTAGEVNGIKRLARENMQITLAVSLHAPNDVLRNKLVPLNRKYNLAVLMDAIEEYMSINNRRVTIEYVLLDQINNSEKEARELISLIKPLNCHVNLIPYNEVKGLPFKRPSRLSIQSFYRILLEAGMPVTLREERGKDIEAACGQLAARKEHKITSAGNSS
ncbi:MAG TPA: 23S rRNA (adenine(2503)-C(2))-methyltransferase RlmN [Syntrophomonadaceae bacterium]|nr:23S rRNA (adenine(2503)-C(2))-methyltransferase RlmN [Syntrophomonadaceae bacterium]